MTLLYGLTVALLLGCARAPAPAAARNCPDSKVSTHTCVGGDCPATLCHALASAETALCGHVKFVGRATCGDRVEVLVAHGLASEMYFYDAKTGALVGSANENDQLERNQAGNADDTGCTPLCLLCGEANTPSSRCPS